MRALINWLLRRTADPAGEAQRGSSDDVAVQRLADKLYRRSLANGGWAADIGAVGSKVFIADSIHALRAVSLGNTQAGPPTP